MFRFKQFSLKQEKSAMKIGTDGVLLGAWAKAENPKNILDIGTGTGLITLMLAQRFPKAEITGIEIDEASAKEAESNLKESKFHHRCQIIHTAFQDFKTEEKFDLIVSNPPFFEVDLHLNERSRKTARQQTSLTFNELLERTGKLLSEKGQAAFIIPFQSENNFLKILKSNHLFPKRITRVKGNENTEIKRSLLQLAPFPVSEIDISLLVIEKQRHQYTEDYINLTRDFYLKM